MAVPAHMVLRPMDLVFVRVLKEFRDMTRESQECYHQGLMSVSSRNSEDQSTNKNTDSDGQACETSNRN